jgi:hypothetical protein
MADSSMRTGISSYARWPASLLALFCNLAVTMTDVTHEGRMTLGAHFRDVQTVSKTLLYASWTRHGGFKCCDKTKLDVMLPFYSRLTKTSSFEVAQRPDDHCSCRLRSETLNAFQHSVRLTPESEVLDLTPAAKT